MENIVRRTLIAALVAGLIVLVAPGAQAATRDLADASGDVMTATMGPDEESITYNRQGGAEGDIVFARIQHTATHVVMYMRYRQLSVPRQYAAFQYILEGNNDEFAVVDIETRRGDPQGDALAFGSRRMCAMGYRINYAHDSVSVRIRRGCMARPKYVRLTHFSLQLRGDESAMRVLYDNPARDGGTVNQVVNAVTPWVVTS